MNPYFKINGCSYNEWVTLALKDELSVEVKNHIETWNSKVEFFTFQTSGSTGKPKNISISRKYLIHSAKVTGDYFGLQEKDTALLCLPVGFIAGRMMLVRAMVLGLDLHISKPQISEICKSKKKINFCAMTPYQVFKILETDVSFFNRIGTLIVGGGEIDLHLEKKILSLKTECFATFGMTETISHIALKKIVIGNKNIFHALNGVKFSCSKNNQLIIDAPEWNVNHLLTNDIVQLYSSNSFEWKGRADNVINTGGIKISPEKLEKDLGTIINTPFFISSLPDKLLGNKIILIIQGKKVSVNLTIFSKTETPKEIYFLPNFVFTPTGKTDRHKTLKLLSREVLD